MCKYCDCKERYSGYEKEGAQIAEGQYSGCCIIQPTDSKEYFIAVAGDGDDFWQYNEPISYCPFCGKKLIELINFIKQQPLISHAIPVLVDGKPIVKVELIEDGECGYAFNLETN